jgi:glycosyltransferase involved in cell wall biosynthesis
MRIAQVSPLHESVPPKLYGGTERVVHFLTEALVDLGHDVTLFASGDSRTSAELVACSPQALRLDPGCTDPLAHHVRMLEEVFARASDFDVIHFHIDYIHFGLARRHAVPHVTTTHGRMDIPDLAPLFHTFADVPLVSISDAQREPLPRANWCATVYHGLPPDLYSFRPGKGGYLASLGRISPEKRVDRAIDIARRLGMPLKIAAKIDKKDLEYYETKIKPMIAAYPGAEFIGEIGEADKNDFLGDAAALLFPVDWPEPFGLVMIEAMACGTPVVAFRCGSVPEVMRDGVSGYVVDTVDEAVAATARVVELPRERCRAYFEQRFLARRMAADYAHVYAELAQGARRRSGRGRTAIGLAAIDSEHEHDSEVTTGATANEAGLGMD